jgi:hypothetical protein
MLLWHPSQLRRGGPVQRLQEYLGMSEDLQLWKARLERRQRVLADKLNTPLVDGIVAHGRALDARPPAPFWRHLISRLTNWRKA